MKWIGPDKLREFLVPLSSLKPDPENARLHDDRNLEAVRTSLRANGQVQVLVIYQGFVMAGNARLEVMEEEEWTHAAVLDVTDHFESMDQARAYALMDNKAGDLADWDYEKVGKLFRTLPEAHHMLTGFSAEEIATVIKADWTPPDTNDEDAHPTGKGHAIAFTDDQWTIVRGAIAKVKDAEDGPADASDGRCLELICADFLS